MNADNVVRVDALVAMGKELRATLLDYRLSDFPLWEPGLPTKKALWAVELVTGDIPWLCECIEGADIPEGVSLVAFTLTDNGPGDEDGTPEPDFAMVEARNITPSVTRQILEALEPWTPWAVEVPTP